MHLKDLVLGKLYYLDFGTLDILRVFGLYQEPAQTNRNCIGMLRITDKHEIFCPIDRCRYQSSPATSFWWIFVASAIGSGWILIDGNIVNWLECDPCSLQ